MAPVTLRKRKRLSIFTSDQTVGSFQEGPDGGHEHAAHGVQEQAQQDVLQAAQRYIEPARQPPVALKSVFAKLPQVLGWGSHWARPTAKTLAQQPGHRREGQ